MYWYMYCTMCAHVLSYVVHGLTCIVRIGHLLVALFGYVLCMLWCAARRELVYVAVIGDVLGAVDGLCCQ